MRKFVSIALSATLVFGINTNAEAAIIKTCSVKQVNLVKNNQVCKKVGILYRWVALPTPKTTKIIAPITTLNPTSPTPIETVPVTVVTQPKTTIDPRMQAFYDAMKSVQQISGPKDVPVEYVFDPQIPQKFIDWIKNGTNLVLHGFGNTFADGKQIYVIGAYSNAYAKNAWQKLYSENKVSPALFQVNMSSIDRFFPSVVNKYSSGAWATMDGNTLVITYAGNSDLPLRAHLMITAIHETFHQVQWNLNNRETMVLPCWYAEGGANFIGLSLVNELTDKQTFDIIVSQLGTRPDTGFDFRKLEGVSGRIYGSQFCGDVGEYQQGAILNAYLVEKFGIQKYLDFFKVVQSANSMSSDWVQLFEKHFGESVDNFYAEAEEYVRWFYAQYFDGYTTKINIDDGM